MSRGSRSRSKVKVVGQGQKCKKNVYFVTYEQHKFERSCLLGSRPKAIGQSLEVKVMINVFRMNFSPFDLYEV